MNGRGPRIVLYGCFFISGASALIYQIVWQRMLTLVFGLSTMSVAAVLAAFLAGLAAGARIFGPWVDRSRRPLRLYGLVEVGIAAAGLASAYWVEPLMQTFTALYRGMEPGWLGSNLIRFGLAFAAFGLSSILLGATAPVMAVLLARRGSTVAGGFSRFYAVNTAGSVAGAALAGFALIRLWGVGWTLATAIAGNLAVGLVVLTWAGLKEKARAADQPVGEAAPALEFEPRAGDERFVLVAAAVGGAIALGYEVVWTRLLAVYTLNSVYVFTMVVSVYLAALAAGAAATEPLVRWVRGARRELFVAAQLLLALLAPVTLAAIPSAGGLELNRAGLDERYIFTREYLLAAAVVFFPTMLIGMSLPLLVGMIAERAERAGRTVGRVYAWNSAGTIAGAALTGALLVPLAGMRGTMLLLAAGGFALAAWAAASKPRTRLGGGVISVAAVAFVVLVAMCPGTARFALPSRERDERIIYYAEGPSAIIHIGEAGEKSDSFRLLYVDSKSVAGTYDEIVTDQKMLAHLPLLLHPSPKRVLTVGFGTGGTSYSMLLHGIQVDCVEIEPAVPAASTWFASENHGLVGIDRGPGTYRLVLDDARAWMHVAPAPYDVIVTDVTSIQYRGNGNLYTADYFRLMQEQLNEGGLGCAWVPISGITPEQLRVLVRTFQSVFEHTSVWYMLNLPTDFVILVGSASPLEVDAEAMAARMKPGVRRDLAAIGMNDVCKIAAGLLGADAQVRAYTGDGPLHTDDRPVLDYMTHASAYQHTLAQNLRELAAMGPTQFVQTTDSCRASFDAGAHLLAGHIAISEHTLEATAEALAHYRAAAELRPDDEAIQKLLERFTSAESSTQ